MQNLLIQSIYDYSAANKEEISFTAGQIMGVLDDEEYDDWYLALNALTDSEGYVPKAYFKVLSAETVPEYSIPTIKMGKGIVEHDFHGESEFELSAKRGDFIQIMDDSDPEWFFARHPNSKDRNAKIIPKSFVRIVATQTVVDDGESDLDSFDSVFETPKLDYFDKTSQIFRDTVFRKQSMSKLASRRKQSLRIDVSKINDPTAFSDKTLPRDGYRMAKPNQRGFTARLVSYDQMGPKHEWTFVIDVAPDETVTPTKLHRNYDQFYDMHTILLNLFPGVDDYGQRLIPLMPGPESVVTAQIAMLRRIEFSTYIIDLVNLPYYIKSCDCLTSFFGLDPVVLSPISSMRKEMTVPPAWLTANRKSHTRSKVVLSGTENNLYKLGSNPSLTTSDVELQKTASIYSHKNPSRVDLLKSPQLLKNKTSILKVVGSFNINLRIHKHNLSLHVSHDSTYKDFKDLLVRKLQEKNVSAVGEIESFLYADEDGDWIVIDSSEDFRITMASHRRRNIRMQAVL